MDHKYFVNDTEGSKAIQFDCFDEFLIAQSLSRKIIENEISICTFYFDFPMSDQKLNFPRWAFATIRIIDELPGFTITDSKSY